MDYNPSLLPPGFSPQNITAPLSQVPPPSNETPFHVPPPSINPLFSSQYHVLVPPDHPPPTYPEQRPFTPMSQDSYGPTYHEPLQSSHEDATGAPSYTASARERRPCYSRTPPPHEIITSFTPPPSTRESTPAYKPPQSRELVVNVPPPSYVPPPSSLPTSSHISSSSLQSLDSHFTSLPPLSQPPPSVPSSNVPPPSVSIPPPAKLLLRTSGPPPNMVSSSVPPPCPVSQTKREEQFFNQATYCESFSGTSSESSSVLSYYSMKYECNNSTGSERVTKSESTGRSSKDENARKQEEFILKCMYPKRKHSPPPRRSPTRVRAKVSPSYSRKSESSRFSRGPSNERYRDRGTSSESSRSRARTNEGSKRNYSHSDGSDKKISSRQKIVEKWRMNNCSSTNEMTNQMEEICQMKPEDLMEREKIYWTRTAPADLYYSRINDSSNVLRATDKLIGLCDKFESDLVKRGEKVREIKPPYDLPKRKKRLRKHKCCQIHSDSESDSESDEDSDSDDGLMEELERKKSHPDRLHPELWYNDPGEMNDGPLCRCSAKAKRSGIRHNIYAGELNLLKCDINTNNSDKLHHYRITISPPTNFLIKTPTIIEHDHHEFIFEGFSMLSHKPLENLPVCKVIRFNIEYTILYIEEKMPDHFTIRELDLFYEYLFKEILELVDLDLKAAGDSNGCAQFHFMPRFVRELPENGKEILSMNVVLSHLLCSSKSLIEEQDLSEVINLPLYKWQNLVDEVKGMVVTFPGKKPCSLRIDQLDKDQSDAKEGEIKFPEIVHFGIRPPQLSYAGNPEYQKAWREYVKFRHLLANMPKASFEDKRKLEAKETKLQEMRTQSKMKRDVTIAISSEGFYRTGIMCDIVQHAMLIPVLASHLRFHRSLDVLETDINYRFKNRSLLQLALTHPSYRENFGTNPDHARNSLTNCGIRQPEYGDRRIHYMNTRKRGINTLINIMSRFGKKRETESNITHNERLEFLGDAVVEFVTSIHLFHLFPRLEEGGLATYRAAIVQNQHLAVLAKTLKLDSYMLYAHGSDLCHDLELRHAMANCFEALMGALFLDGAIETADKVFGETLFKDSDELLQVWVNYPPHPLQEQEPTGDRQWIASFKILQDLTEFEESIGVPFTHIRLLARAFTDRSIGFTNLTLGSNQRLEFLGDTVLQLIASDYLYKHFPEHHEGHLSLLRSSLVNNRTQSVVCDDLGMSKYAIYANPKAELKTKDRADLLEAFLGALYVDKGIEFCETFCNVCFFPRLHDFIMHQDWNDPKSKLQQCCLTLRTMEGGEPEIPIYKVIECMGPTNTRLYTVAVYFKGKRLAQASGHSIQQAEMNSAKQALENSQRLFPQLDHQKRVIAKSMKRQRPPAVRENTEDGDSSSDSSSGETDYTYRSKESNGFQRRRHTPGEWTKIDTESSDSSDESELFNSPPRKKFRSSEISAQFSSNSSDSSNSSSSNDSNYKTRSEADSNEEKVESPETS